MRQVRLFWEKENLRSKKMIWLSILESWPKKRQNFVKSKKKPELALRICLCYNY